MSRTAPRRLRRAGAIAGVLGLCAASWFAAISFQSPAQRAAARRPPDPQPITAAVESGPLVDAATFQGEVRAERSSAVAAPAAERLVVTAVHSADGVTMQAGDALLAMNGRPLLVFPGAFPLYRDLAAGDAGADVVLVQDGLRAAGYAIPNGEAGTFGLRTQAAIAAVYRDVGYPLPPVPADVVTRLAELEALAVAPEADDQVIADLVVARRRAGPRLPVAEAVITAATPATVRDVVPVGHVPSEGDQLALLDSGAPRVVATTSPGAVADLAVGAPLTISATGVAEVPGHIETLEVTEPTSSAGAAPTAAEATLVVAPDAPLDVLPGTTALLTSRQELASADARVVPATAVAERGGRSYVTVRRAGGWEELGITVVARLAGAVAVTTSDPSVLAVGDRVLVGRA